MIYLDTHVVVWLYAGLTDKLSPIAIRLINEHGLLISPIAKLELHYLYEIGRVTEPADTIVSDLSKRIGLNIRDTRLHTLVDTAIPLTWTRDPFDRFITAQASIDDCCLITKDERIRTHYSKALW